MRSTLIALALLSPALVTGCRRGLEAAYAALPAEGAPVPAFSFPALGTGQVSDQTLRGAPAVLALWSSGCPASREAMQAVEKLRIAYEPRGVRVLVLADDRAAAPVQRLLDSAGVQFPVGMAGGQLDATFARRSRLPWRRGIALPSFLVLDSSGRVVHRAVGIELEPSTRLENVRRTLNALLVASDDGSGGRGTTVP